MGLKGDADTQLPMRGVVMCCTSIDPETRAQLAAWATEMGAEHKLDLTSDVTHLIVGETQTPKYKYVAKEREDVICLDVDWIPAVRQIWMQGADVNVKELELEHKLRTFHELRICITGFEDPDQRKELESQIANHGGEYRGDLRKDCTHLVCFSPTGAKYTSAKAWGNISTVSVEWLSMSIERGMVLEEDRFDPLLPPESRGEGAWNKAARLSPSLKRVRTGDRKTEGPRKLRRTASSRYSADMVWQDIVPAAKPTPENDVGLRRTHTVPLSKVDTGVEVARALGVNAIPRNQHSGLEVTAPEVPLKRGLFHGKTFLLHGFDERRMQLLQRHLESQDGHVESDVMATTQESSGGGPNRNFTVVPHSSSEADVLGGPRSPHSELVTELWIETCLHRKAFVEPRSEPFYRPFKHPIAGFEKLSISSTGFEGVDLMHLGKVIRLLGATYSEGLSRNTSLLLCYDDSPSRQKFKHAFGWKVPTVNVCWLWACLRSEKLQAWDNFLVPTTAQTSKPRVDGCAPSKSATYEPGQARIKQLLGQQLPSDNLITSSRNKTRAAPAASDGEQRTTTRHYHVTLQGQHRAHEPRSINLGDSAPLHEMSPNRSKVCTPAELPLDNMKKGEEHSLVTSLHCLLARSREHTNPTSIDPLQEAPRKKRQLLGRARSDLSTKSNLSRAESLASMNTDGIGTPLETAPRSPSSNSTLHLTTREDGAFTLSADMLLSHNEEKAQQSDEEDSQAPVLTQIGYDDSEAVVRRARLARKMTGSKQPQRSLSSSDGDNDDDEDDDEEDDNDTAPRKAVLRDAMGTVSKRTRLNTK